MRERYGLETGEGVQPLPSESLKQAMSEGLNLNEKVPVLDIDAMETIGKGDLADLIRSMVGDEPVPTRDFMALVGMPEDRYGQRHKKLTQKVLHKFKDVFRYAVEVEVVPNKKISETKGLTGSRKLTQKRKNKIEEFYRLMLPVKTNGELRTVVITAEKR